MKAILLMAMAGVYLSLQAQPPSEEWIETYDGPGSGYDEIRLVRTDASGNVVVTGSAYSGATTLLDVVTRKYNTQGDLLWSHTWNNPDFGFNDTPKDMAIAPNGNIIIIGNSKQSSSSQSNNADIFVIALSGSGTLLWSDHFSGTGYTSGGGSPIDVSSAAGVAVTNGGDVIVSGFVTGNSSTELYQMALAKYNAAGSIQWMETFDSSTAWGYNDIGTDVKLDAAGNIYVCGYTTNATTWIDPAVWKIGSDGQQIWDASYSGPDNSTSEQFDEILVDDAGNSYAFGTNSSDNYVLQKRDPSGVEQWTQVLDTIISSITSTYSGSDARLAFDGNGNIILATSMNSRIGVVRFTPAGDIDWITLVGGSGPGANEAYAVMTDPLSNIYVAGAGGNLNTFYDLGLFKLAPDGSESWSVWQDGPANGTDKGHSLALGDDGAIYVGGVAKGYSASTGDFILVKYADASSGIHYPSTSNLSVYPNPVSTIAYIRLPGPAQVKSLTVFDAQGRMVMEAKPEQARPCQIDLGGLAPGPYVIMVTTAEGTCSSSVMRL